MSERSNMNVQGASSLHQWLYAFACVFVPVAWGFVIVWTTNLIERLATKPHKDSPSEERREFPPIEFHI
jgi:hypothetical protein